MVGSGTLAWPSDQSKRLGLQIALFRAFQEQRVDVTDFAIGFLYTDGNYDDYVSSVVSQIFRPMARELRRRLVRELQSSSTTEVPASDRIVSLDHNSPEYNEAVGSLEKLETALRETNDYSDFDDKEQRIAEISATRRLLEAPRVDVEKVKVTGLRTLRYLGDKAVGATVGFAVAAALGALAKLLGLF